MAASAAAASTPAFQVGDAVQITPREQTSADIKSGLYYPHFAGLGGSILKLYGEEASVLVDRATMPEGVRVRHEENETAMRQRYLDGLSEEARGRLTPAEKNFELHYSVLVSLKDLQKPTAAGAAAKNASAKVIADDADAKRASSKDLDVAEAAFLASRKS